MYICSSLQVLRTSPQSTDLNKRSGLLDPILTQILFLGISGAGLITSSMSQRSPDVWWVSECSFLCWCSNSLDTSRGSSRFIVYLWLFSSITLPFLALKILIFSLLVLQTPFHVHMKIKWAMYMKVLCKLYNTKQIRKQHYLIFSMSGRGEETEQNQSQW